MAKAGRNDQCTCRSGKTHNKYCLAKRAAPASLAGADREVALGSLTRFMRAPGWIERWKQAFDEFWNGLDPETTTLKTEPDLVVTTAQVFEWWFFFDYEYEPKRRVVDAFLAAAPRLGPGARRYLELARETTMRLYEVTEVRPGAGMTLRDVIGGAETRVVERSGSWQLRRGDFMGARVMQLSASSEPVLESEVLPIRAERAPALIAAFRASAASGEYDSDEQLYECGVPALHRAWIGPMKTPARVERRYALED